MASLAFDTLKAARRLGDAGFSDEQADAIVGTMADSVAENLATKDDLKLLDAKIDGVAERLEAKIDGVAERLDTKIDRVEERLDAKIDGSAKYLLIRLGGLMAGGIALIIAAQQLFP